MTIFGGRSNQKGKEVLSFFRCALKGASGVPFPAFLLRCLISNYAGSRDLTRNASLAIRAKKIAPNAIDLLVIVNRDRCVGAGARLVGNGNVVDQATKSLCCGQNDCKEVPAANVIQPRADHRWHFSFAIDVAVRCPRLIASAPKSAIKTFAVRAATWKTRSSNSSTWTAELRSECWMSRDGLQCEADVCKPSCRKIPICRVRQHSAAAEL
jgi:hypothetical protein